MVQALRMVYYSAVLNDSYNFLNSPFRLVDPSWFGMNRMIESLDKFFSRTCYNIAIVSGLTHSSEKVPVDEWGS